MSRTVTLKGNPLHLEGPELMPGDTAPDAVLRKDLVSDYRLSEGANRLRVYSVVPSLDTPVCSLQTKRFNQEALALDGVDFYTISCDLPVAQARFCGAEGIDTNKVIMLSDHKDTDFGRKYGVLINELRILCRAVFVVEAGGKVVYAEYVPEVTEHPNYDAVLAAIRNAG